jgi:hypothetical protein
MRIVWLTAGLVLLLATISAAQFGGMLMTPDDPSCRPMWDFTRQPPKISSPNYVPSAMMNHESPKAYHYPMFGSRDPRYPGVYDTWRFRYACEPGWFVIEGWPTQETCEAGRKRFLAVNPAKSPDEQITKCYFYANMR